MYPSTYVTMWRCIYTALDYPYPPAEYPLQEPNFVTSMDSFFPERETWLSDCILAATAA